MGLFKTKIKKQSRIISCLNRCSFLLLTIIFCCCVSVTVSAQSNNDKLIPGDTLQWKYFTGTPDTVSGYWSYTLWNVYYNYKVVSFHSDTVKINLQLSHYLNTRSWVLQDKASDKLLQHEQGHFNMALIFEKEFRAALDTTALFIDRYNTQIDSVFNKVLNNINDMGIKYDDETDHMWNRKAQARWNKKIGDMIAEMKK